MYSSKGTPVATSPSKTPRWSKVAIYAGLVALIVVLNYLAARNEGRPEREASRNDSTAASRKLPRDRPASDHDVSPATRRGTNSNSTAASNRRDRADAAQPTGANPNSDSNAPPAASGNELIVHNMRIRDEDGRVVYRGEVDLRPTLDRIERGKRLRFPNDGSVFENRERRLPAKPTGYYHEYVLPTPGDRGPGAQRIVTEREGEVFYTPDHYRTFRRIQ